MKLKLVTGFVGSGKTTVMQILAKELNYIIISADDVAKELLQHSDTQKFIRLQLPSRFKNINFTTKELTKLIFFNQQFNIIFNSIFWPLVKAKIVDQIKLFKNAGVERIAVETLDTTTLENWPHQKWFIQVADIHVLIKRVKEKYPLFDHKQILKLLTIQSAILKINYEAYTIITNEPTLNKLAHKIKNLK